MRLDFELNLEKRRKNINLKCPPSSVNVSHCACSLVFLYPLQPFRIGSFRAANNPSDVRKWSENSSGFTPKTEVPHRNPTCVLAIPLGGTKPFEPGSNQILIGSRLNQACWYS